MSTNYNNPMQPAPLPMAEQVPVKRKSSGVSIATFIISLVVVEALLGAGGWFLGSNGGYSNAQSDFRSNPQAFIQSAGGTGGFGAGGPGANGGAAAPSGGGPGGGNQGQITAINGNTLTLVTAEQTITVNMDNNTTVVKVGAGTNGDLAVGSQVTVSGQTSGSTVTATRIVLGNLSSVVGAGAGGPPPGAGGAPANGTPTPAGGNGLGLLIALGAVGDVPGRDKSAPLQRTTAMKGRMAYALMQRQPCPSSASILPHLFRVFRAVPRLPRF